MADLPTEPPLSPPPGATNSQGLPIGPVVSPPTGSTTEDGLPTGPVPGLTDVTQNQTKQNNSTGTILNPTLHDKSASRIPSLQGAFPKGVGFLFQIVDANLKPNPASTLQVVVPPSSLDISMNKIITRTMTRGGWMEEHWGDSLSDISAQQSTAGFLWEGEGGGGGLTRINAKKTFAYSNFKLLFEMYRNNGLGYDLDGNVVENGRVRIVYDNMDIYGYFTDFNVDETADTPYRFNLRWSFKVQEMLVSIPSILSAVSI